MRIDSILGGSKTGGPKQLHDMRVDLLDNDSQSPNTGSPMKIHKGFSVQEQYSNKALRSRSLLIT